MSKKEQQDYAREVLKERREGNERELSIEERLKILEKQTDDNGSLIFNSGLTMGFKYGLYYAQHKAMELTQDLASKPDEEIKDFINNEIIKKIKNHKESKREGLDE